MPSPVVNFASVVLCTHAGKATPVAPFPRVVVAMSPVVTIACPYIVAGCTLSAVPSPPCVSGQFMSGATRVLAGGVPVAVQVGQSLCAPTAQPMIVAVTQPRVLAT